MNASASHAPGAPFMRQAKLLSHAPRQSFLLTPVSCLLAGVFGLRRAPIPVGVGSTGGKTGRSRSPACGGRRSASRSPPRDFWRGAISDDLQMAETLRQRRCSRGRVVGAIGLRRFARRLRQFSQFRRPRNRTAVSFAHLSKDSNQDGEPPTKLRRKASFKSRMRMVAVALGLDISLLLEA